MDVTKTKGTLQLTLGYSDGSNDLLLLDNAKASIAGSEIDSLETFLTANNILLGNDGATLTAITDARIISNEKTTLDLS